METVTIEVWRWAIPAEARVTNYRMTEERARQLYPEAVRVEGSGEVLTFKSAVDIWPSS